jgi:hypothetical protein
MEISDKELHILQYALGLTYGGKQYRNFFSTGEGSVDYPHCEALVKKGLMIKRDESFNDPSIEYIYYVTAKGVDFIRSKRWKKKIVEVVITMTITTDYVV